MGVRENVYNRCRHSKNKINMHATFERKLRSDIRVVFGTTEWEIGPRICHGWIQCLRRASAGPKRRREKNHLRFCNEVTGKLWATVSFSTRAKLERFWGTLQTDLTQVLTGTALLLSQRNPFSNVTTTIVTCSKPTRIHDVPIFLKFRCFMPGAMHLRAQAHNSSNT